MNLDAHQASESSRQASPPNDESIGDGLFMTSLAMNLRDPRGNPRDSVHNIQLIRSKLTYKHRVLGWLTKLKEGLDAPESSPYAFIAQKMKIDSEALAALIKKVETPSFFD